MTQTTTQMDPKAILAALMREYTGKAPAPEATGAQIREALRQTPEYKERYARLKDEGMALDDMRYRTVKGQELPAWLLNGNFEKSFKGVKKGHGAIFRLPNGSTRFVDYGGPMPGDLPVLTEFVFPGTTINRVVDDGSESYDIREKPVQKKHGKAPPPSDLAKAIARCWTYVPKKGIVTGESFDQEFAVLTVTDKDDDIRFFPPGEFNDKPTLRFLANDAEGTTVEVEADPAAVAPQLNLSPEAPASRWQRELRGRLIAANGQLSVFRAKGDRFFGRDGALAELVSQQATRMVPRAKDPSKQDLSLKDLYDPKANPAPAIQVGDKYVYRLEARQSGDKTYHTAYVRADMETDSKGRPMPPTLNCVVKSGNKNGKDWTMNEGAFVSVIGSGDGKASSTAQSLLAVE